MTLFHQEMNWSERRFTSTLDGRGEWENAVDREVQDGTTWLELNRNSYPHSVARIWRLSEEASPPVITEASPLSQNALNITLWFVKYFKIGQAYKLPFNLYNTFWFYL